MVDQQPNIRQPEVVLDSEPADAGGAVWDALVAEDESQIDPDLLGAWAEGRLPEQERQRLRTEISRSPRAMELLDGLQEHISHPVRESAGLPAPAPSRDLPAPTRSTLPRGVASFVAAAMLLCAVGTSWWAVRSTRELADLRSDLNAQRQQLNAAQEQLSASAGEIDAYREALDRTAASTKEQLYSLSGSQRPFVTEVMSPQLLALAMTDDTPRSLNDLSPDQREQRATELAAILSPAGNLFLPFATRDHPDAALKWADILIAAGEWEQARDLLNSTEPAGSPQVLNLRAGVLLAQAADLANETGDDVDQQIERLQQRAQTLLNESVNLDPEYDPAWFNLYRLDLVMEDYAAAEHALENYTRITGRAAE